MLRVSVPFRLAVLVAALGSGGCHWTLTDPSTDPKSYQFDFPTGIAMDPDGRFAYVSNGNADLAFGGGTVMVVDTQYYECTVARMRQVTLHIPPPAACGLPPADTPTTPPFPIDYDKQIKDANCELDPSDLSIVDCDEGPFILRDSTVKIGNFAGEIRMQRYFVPYQDPDDPNHTLYRLDDQHRRLYIAVRGDPSVTWIDVRIPDPNAVPPRPELHCSAKPERLPKQDLTVTAGCDPATHLVQSYVCKDMPSCLLGLDNKHPGTTQLPTEPFAIQLDQSTPDDPAPYQRLLVAHQGTGQVSLIDAGATPRLLTASLPFFQPDAQGNHGAFGMAQQHRHSRASAWYLTTNLFPQIETFRIAEANVIQLQSQIGLQSTYAFGNDIREIQFEPSGNRAFVTENNPPSLLTLDTRVLPGPTGGLPANAVTSNVDVCQTPSHFGVRRMLMPGAPGEPTQLRTRVYVVCFLSSEVMVVDPDLPGVVSTIFSGVGGPNEIAFNFESDDAAPQDQVKQTQMPRRAYVTNYSESTIAVIDLEPGSPTENHVIARLGFPPTGPQP